MTQIQRLAEDISMPMQSLKYSARFLNDKNWANKNTAVEVARYLEDAKRHLIAVIKQLDIYEIAKDDAGTTEERFVRELEARYNAKVGRSFSVSGYEKIERIELPETACGRLNGPFFGPDGHVTAKKGELVHKKGNKYIIYFRKMGTDNEWRRVEYPEDEPRLKRYISFLPELLN